VRASEDIPNLPDPEVRPWLTVEEALPFLPCGRNGAYAAIKSGQIPSLRVGRKIVIPTAALRRLAQIDAA
jgi:excisionase family DNA binding protein